jgi:hypothetical protein
VVKRLRGDGQIAFVLAIFIVNDDDHFARAYGGYGIFNPSNGAGVVVPDFHDLESLPHVRS